MRPRPPEILTARGTPDDFRPGNLTEFVHASFLNESSKLFNPEHLHLLSANIAYLWTNVPNIKAGRQVLGTAEIIRYQGGKWQRTRQMIQMRDWFGIEPLDFLITLDAMYCDFVGDLEFLALLEHELYHCGQAKDEFGAPKFNRETGLPMFALRGHDVEEFLGIWRRYGFIGEQGEEILQLAAADEPEIGQTAINQICGNCVK